MSRSYALQWPTTIPAMMLLLAIWTLFITSISGAAVFTAGQTFSIVLNSVPDLNYTLQPANTEVWDVDMYDSDATVITGLKAQGKIVVCYFSAGTYENWRTQDSEPFPKADIGKQLKEWPNEYWLNTRSDAVRRIIGKRIEYAAAKGCDAVDPDNTDGDQNDNGLKLTAQDSISYINFMVTKAHSLGLSIGLKNSLGILPNVQSSVDFAVNEECAKNKECTAYDSFVKTLKKPVFHIEYAAKVPQVTQAERNTFCNSAGVPGLSTIIKNMTLDGWVMNCDGTTYNTSTRAGANPPPPPGNPCPKCSTSSRPPPGPTTTSRVTTISSSSTSIFTPPPPPSTTTKVTTKSTTTPKPTTTSRPPTPPPGGCTVAKWGQCGGQDYHGCTTCASGSTCKSVSPPWYYQCL